MKFQLNPQLGFYVLAGHEERMALRQVVVPGTEGFRRVLSSMVHV
jgi:hypothetical protein